MEELPLLTIYRTVVVICYTSYYVFYFFENAKRNNQLNKLRNETNKVLCNESTEIKNKVNKLNVSLKNNIINEDKCVIDEKSNYQYQENLKKSLESIKKDFLKDESFKLDFHIHISKQQGMEENLEKIARLRSLILLEEPNCVDEWVLNDNCLWRYLVARSHDIQAAKRHAIAAIHWRALRSPDKTIPQQIKVELETGKVMVLGPDRFGRPVLVVDSSKENTWDGQGNMLALTYQIDRAIRMMKPPVEKYVVVVRLADTSVFNFSKFPPPSVVRETIKVLMTVYAERMGHAILYQPPKIFSAFLNIFKSIMDARVLSKVVWITGDVSPGSVNDRLMNSILGENWKIFTGQGQPVLNPKWAAGFDPEIEWKRLIAEASQHSNQ